VPFSAPPFPGPLATAKQRKAYEQYRLELAKRPPPAPPPAIDPSPNLFDVIREGFDNAYQAGREDARKEEQGAKSGKMTGVVEDDAILFGKHRDGGLSAKRARREVINDLIKLGVHPPTAANRATAAKAYWEDNLAVK
jgi:hypothetical protein